MFTDATLEAPVAQDGLTVAFVRGAKADREGVLKVLLAPQEAARHVFKDDAQRLVFRAETVCGPVLVKHFRLPRLKDRLRNGRFAKAEYLAHSRALAQGLPCPALVAVYERRRWGLCRECGLVYGFLDGFRDLAQGETALAAEMVARLSRAGINHADFVHTNVMVNDATGETRLIDLENSTAVPPGSIEAPLMQTQRFIEFGGLGFDHPESQAFIAQTHASLKTPLPLEDFRACVKILLQRHRSRKERRLLRLPPEVRVILDPLY